MSSEERQLHLEFKNVSKVYGAGKLNVIKNILDRLKNFQFSKKNLVDASPFYALKNVSFKICKGERVGIIGHNGAGKSTILKLIQGVTVPSTGECVHTAEKIGGLIELGAGFDHELSAIENVHLGMALLGYSHGATEGLINEIFQIAELDQFRNVLLKKFSSGMKMRLGFAVALAAQPDIILLDEILAVGDMRFRKKSLPLIEQYLEGKTLIFVSHDLNQMKTICDRLIILNHGEILFDGSTEEGVDKYTELMELTSKGKATTHIPGMINRGQSIKSSLEVYDISLDQSQYLNRGHLCGTVVLSENRAPKNDPSVIFKISKVALSNINVLIDQISIPINGNSLRAKEIGFRFSIDQLLTGNYVVEVWCEEANQSKQTEVVIKSHPFEISRGGNKTNRLLNLNIELV
jgi:ABC-type polysaccharide/polyol phosphate transport system ATPase subunit